MAGVPFSEEIFNTREEVVSEDLMRAQRLISRDVQEVFSGEAETIPGTAAVSATSLLTSGGVPISGLTHAPAITAPSGFTMTVGAGSGFNYYSSVGVTADYSPYQVMRWPATVVTYAAPHATLPRIDLVYAVIGSVNTDVAVRNILIDPNARTVAAQAVNKTANPLSTLAVASGTAAATPLPPATPTGALPLFYTYVPAAAASAANFTHCRASWRRAGYPFSSMNRVLHGMGIKWDLTADPAAASAAMIAKGFHRIIIDGEVMEFFADLDSTTGCVVPDTANNPFSAAAPATRSKPYYIYAVGGRHNPLPCYNGSVPSLSPVTLVESLTVPSQYNGMPTATLTANGVTIQREGAVYVGLGFVHTNTTNRKPMIMTDEMTISAGSVLESGVTGVVAAGVTPSMTLLGIPAISQKIVARVDFGAANAGSARSAWLALEDGAGGIPPGAAAGNGQAAIPQTDINTQSTIVVTLLRPQGHAAAFRGFAATNGDAFDIRPIGYSHGVAKVGPTVNQ